MKRPRHARRALLVALCLIPVIAVAAWQRINLFCRPVLAFYAGFCGLMTALYAWLNGMPPEQMTQMIGLLGSGLIMAIIAVFIAIAALLCLIVLATLLRPLWRDARGVALALEADRPVWLHGEPTLLNELLSNLMDNALAHTPVGGNVILRVSAPAVLEVEDDGPGIPLDERDRVFERFYRRNQQVAGSGLGLAIVGEICRAHLAQISLHDGAQAGLKVRVSFIAG